MYNGEGNMGREIKRINLTDPPTLEEHIINIEEPKPTQVQIKGINLRNILDDGFLGAMEKAMGKNPYYASLQIINEDGDKREIISLFHSNKEHTEENLLHIDADSPETLSKVQKVVLKYYEGCENVSP